MAGALLSNLGGYLCAQKKLEEAEPVLKRALEVLDGALGCDNEYTSACLTNYARLLKDLDRTDQLNELKAKYSSSADTFTATEALEKVLPSSVAFFLLPVESDDLTSIVMPTNAGRKRSRDEGHGGSVQGTR